MDSKIIVGELNTTHSIYDWFISIGELNCRTFESNDRSNQRNSQITSRWNRKIAVIGRGDEKTD
jgi:hypothetical protein